MNLLDLTVNQLKRAAAIKEQIEALQNELGNILGDEGKPRAVRTKRRVMSDAKTSISPKSATHSIKRVTKPKKKVFSAATRAKLSAKLKAHWAAKKAGKK